MATLVQQAVNEAICLSFHTYDEAYAKGLINQAIDIEVQLLQRVVENGKNQEDRDHAKHTMNQLLWDGGHKYTFKPADIKVVL